MPLRLYFAACTTDWFFGQHRKMKEEAIPGGLQLMYVNQNAPTVKFGGNNKLPHAYQAYPRKWLPPRPDVKWHRNAYQFCRQK